MFISLRTTNDVNGWKCVYKLCDGRDKQNVKNQYSLIEYRIGEGSKWSSWLSLDSMKDYFDVTNSYVFSKLRIILFPVTLKVKNFHKNHTLGR